LVEKISMWNVEANMRHETRNLKHLMSGMNIVLLSRS
jgi:hypothetical protein